MELIRTPKVDNVRMLDRLANSSIASGSGKATATMAGSIGTLYLTATHLIFVDREGKRETWVLHSLLSHLEKLSITTVGTPLNIRCKNFRSITFVVPKERDAHDIYTSLYHLSQPNSIDDLYCFQYSASNEPFERRKRTGWNKFSLLDEFKRQGLPNSAWVVSSINKDYEICDTYPRYLVVPASAQSNTLNASSRFRSRGRMPVLSYLYSGNGAAICRCSQPLSGFSARCVEDEELLDCILKTKEKAKVLYVVDTRPKINAMANKAAGKGYENETYYENIKFHFFGIENIHVMRGSLQKLLEATELKVLSVNAFLSGIEASGWLKHIRSILETASFIAKSINEGITVIVHCSDGWDRTAQTCSLAALLLDPYHRTIDGFEALIEKEWLSFGHKFTERCGHVQTGDQKETAPIFTQFIDSVWQIMQQFPFEFEFNEAFLLTLHDHVFSCQFGTFVGNCEKERQSTRLNERTYSLWAYLDVRRDQYINPLYEIKKRNTYGNGQSFQTVLDLNCSPQMIRFWTMLYNRFDSGIHPRESINELMVVSYNHIKSLEAHIAYLEEHIKDEEEALLLKQQEEASGSHTSDSFDSIDYPLKIVKECMQRLELKQREESGDQEEKNDSTANPVPDKSALHLDLDSNYTDKRRISNDLSDAINEVESVAVDWASFRETLECSCGTPFDQASIKFHCYSCGKIFCVRCIDKKINLPGHKSKNAPADETSSDEDLFEAKEADEKLKERSGHMKVLVCHPCFKKLGKSPP